jgi:ABC-2 type transport system ATP-binding protein
MVMDKGRVIADDTAAALKANLAGDVLTFGFAGEADAAAAVAVIQRLTDREVRAEGADVTLTAPDGDALLPTAVRALDAAGITVQRATGVPPTLDDVFLALTGRTLREAGEGEAEETEENTDAPAGASGSSAAASGGPRSSEMEGAQR